MLPVVIAEAVNGTLTPLAGPATSGYPQWPKGKGNIAIAKAGPGPSSPGATHPAWVLANQVRDTLLAAEQSSGREIQAIGIDSPRHPATGDLQLRSCETAMAAGGISFIRTPSSFHQICATAAKYCGTVNTLPHKNQLWMIQGFALFDVLSAQWGASKVVETYPYAAFRQLGVTTLKAQVSGRNARLTVLEKYCGLTRGTLQGQLCKAAVGAEHDKIDAFLSAALAWRHGSVLGSVPGEQIVMPVVTGGGALATFGAHPSTVYPTQEENIGSPAKLRPGMDAGSAPGATGVVPSPGSEPTSRTCRP